jgi:hypothetical protein
MEGDNYSLQSSVVLVYAEQWSRSTGVGGGKLMSSSGALHCPPFFKGEATTTAQLYAGMAELVTPLSG